MTPTLMHHIYFQVCKCHRTFFVYYYLNKMVFFMCLFLFTDPDDPYKLLDDTRALGLVVCRGTSVVLICPMDGMEAIPNPFITQDG